MTTPIAHLQARAETFGALWKLYADLSENGFIDDIERAVYADVADLLNQIEDRFGRGVKLDDQMSLELEPVLALTDAAA